MASRQNYLDDIFIKMAMVQAFEKEVVNAIKAGLITIPVYLSSGQDEVAAILSVLCGNKWHLFPQHRCHDMYLCFGGDPRKLRDELLCRMTGTSQGKAGSNCINSPKIKMWGHHGLIGENVPLAVGFAFATKKPTICVFGDGAAEEDYVLASLGFAATHKVPVVFICTDNNLSVLTEKKDRRSWNLVDVAKGFGFKIAMNLDSAINDENGLLDTFMLNMLEVAPSMPRLFNITVERKYWHVGAGIDTPLKRDQFMLLQKHVTHLALLQAIMVEEQMNELWREVYDE